MIAALSHELTCEAIPMRWIVLFFCALAMTVLAFLLIVTGVSLLGTPTLSPIWLAWSLLIVVCLGSVRSWVLKPWIDRY